MVWVGHEAGKSYLYAAAYENGAWGAKQRLGVHYAHHGHAFTDEDWTAMMDFADQHLLGKPGKRPFDHFPTEQELDAALAEAKAKARR